MKSLKQIFSEAANYIETHGWQQNDYGGRISTGGGRSSTDRPACLWGAIYSSQGGFSGVSITLENQLNEILRRTTSMPAGPINWNDEVGRTKEEVIAALRAAAAAQPEAQSDA